MSNAADITISIEKVPDTLWKDCNLFTQSMPEADFVPLTVKGIIASRYRSHIN